MSTFSYHGDLARIAKAQEDTANHLKTLNTILGQGVLYFVEVCTTSAKVVHGVAEGLSEYWKTVKTALDSWVAQNS